MNEPIESLIRTMVTPLVDHPDDFQIERHETEDFMEYHLILHPDDVGRIIGKKGRVIRAIRTIVYSVKVRDMKRPRIVIADDLNKDDDDNEEA